jgi:hypothetical protein
MTVVRDDDPNSSDNQTGLVGFEIKGVPAMVSVRTDE